MAVLGYGLFTFSYTDIITTLSQVLYYLRKTGCTLLLISQISIRYALTILSSTIKTLLYHKNCLEILLWNGIVSYKNIAGIEFSTKTVSDCSMQFNSKHFIVTAKNNTNDKLKQIKKTGMYTKRLVQTIKLKKVLIILVCCNVYNIVSIVIKNTSIW